MSSLCVKPYRKDRKKRCVVCVRAHARENEQKRAFIFCFLWCVWLYAFCQVFCRVRMCVCVCVYVCVYAYVCVRWWLWWCGGGVCGIVWNCIAICISFRGIWLKLEWCVRGWEPPFVTPPKNSLGKKSPAKKILWLDFDPTLTYMVYVFKTMKKAL